MLDTLYLQNKIHINWQSGCFHLFGQRQPPTALIIQFDVQNSRVIGWNFNSRFIKSTNSISAKPTNEVTKFENYILACTRFFLRS